MAKQPNRKALRLARTKARLLRGKRNPAAQLNWLNDNGFAATKERVKLEALILAQ